MTPIHLLIFQKIKIVGEYQWKIDPLNKWKDSISIGYPLTNKFFLPMTSTGKVDQFYSEYNAFNPTYLQWDTFVPSTVPTNWDNGTGLGTTIDLKAARERHNGYIRMYAYVTNTESGTSNVKIRYGHAIAAITPSFGIYPVGFAVVPGISNETLDYGLVLTW